MSAIEITAQHAWRDDFPLLQAADNDKSLVYLDSGATTQRPRSVLEAIGRYYACENANVHRGIYALSQRSTEAYENARSRVAQFIHAPNVESIIFTSGATESINLVAHGMAVNGLQPGDEVIVTTVEHHANIVPWQVACERAGACLRVLPIFDDGELDFSALERLFTAKVKLLAVAHVSNVLGNIYPVKKIIAMAHAKHIPVLLDGAQAVGHMPVNVQALDCDFYAFSGHKMYGPLGIGVLYGKMAALEALPVYQTGGSMIQTVRFSGTTYNQLPYKFEAGTPNIVGAVGLGAAIDYLLNKNFDVIMAHERQLTAYLLESLATVPGLKILGPLHSQRIGVVSFVMEDAHPHDIATILDADNIAVRAGHHCAMPLMERLGVSATVRVSLGIYNDFADVDRLVDGLHRVIQLFRRSG